MVMEEVASVPKILFPSHILALAQGAITCIVTFGKLWALEFAVADIIGMVSSWPACQFHDVKWCISWISDATPSLGQQGRIDKMSFAMSPLKPLSDGL
jgi:hypothetical protein